MILERLTPRGSPRQNAVVVAFEPVDTAAEDIESARASMAAKHAQTTARLQVADSPCPPTRGAAADRRSEALRGLIDAIVLTPNQGELQIELKGNLADAGSRHKCEEVAGNW